MKIYRIPLLVEAEPEEIELFATSARELCVFLAMRPSRSMVIESIKEEK